MSAPDDLETARRELAARTTHRDRLAASLDKEQADLDRLERPSLSRLYHTLFGSLDLSLQVERLERDRAAAALAAAEAHLAEAAERVRALEATKAEEERRRGALRERVRAALDTLGASGAPLTDEVVEMAAGMELLQALSGQVTQAREAISAAFPALRLMQERGERAELHPSIPIGESVVPLALDALEQVAPALARLAPAEHVELKGDMATLAGGFEVQGGFEIRMGRGRDHGPEIDQARRVQNAALAAQATLIRALRLIDEAAADNERALTALTERCAEALGLD